MYRKALRSTSLVQPSNLRYYVYDPKSRARMGDPTPQEPPKHVFLYKYQFNVYPDQYQAFIYFKRNKYVAHHYFWFENWQFSYPGEQWHIGSLFWNLFYFLFPLTFFLIRCAENDSAENHRATQSKTYFQQGGMQSDAIFKYDVAALQQ